MVLKIDFNSNDYNSTTNPADSSNRTYGIDSSIFEDGKQYIMTHSFLSERRNLSPYPPIALTGFGAGSLISGQAYGNGQYTTFTPVENANSSWQPFNKSPNGPWRSSNMYTLTTGAYNGSLFTSVSGVGNIYGEYLNFQLPYAIVLDSFYFDYNRSSTVEFRNFAIVGSNDGFTFDLVYRGTVNLPADKGIFFEVANKTTAYNRFRFIAETGSGGQSYIELAEWYLYEDRAPFQSGLISIDLGSYSSNYKGANIVSRSNTKLAGLLKVRQKNLYSNPAHQGGMYFNGPPNCNYVTVNLLEMDGVTPLLITDPYYLSLYFKELV